MQKEDRIVFTVGPKNYSVRDVIDAAHFRGEVEPFWKDFLARIASEKKGGETELDQAAVDDAAVEFRYKYDLITAEETEHWLEERGLTLSDFSDYFAREYWLKTFRAKPEPVPFEEASAELRELFSTEMVLNGELDVMANRLAWRVAAAEEAEIGEAEMEDERAQFVQRSGLELRGISDWLQKLGREKSWLEEVITMEVAFRKARAGLLTAEAAEREIGALRLPLTRFEVETIEFESRDAASEAVLCVRDDGMSMAEIAEEGRYPYRRNELVLENIAEELQQKFLSLTPGSMLEPFAREDGFELSRLLGKTEPKASDPNVRARIEQRILERHFADLLSKRVRWEILPVISE